MLQQPEIAHYLLSLEIVKPSDVVDDALEVTDVSRRNGVFVVTARTGDTIVVKQAGPHSAATLAHEAAVLTALERRPALTGKVPTVVHHDPEAALLVLRTARDARDWLEVSRAGRRHARKPAGRLGRLLAEVHALAEDAVEPQVPGSTGMWALQFPEPDLEVVLTLSQSSRRLVGQIQNNTRLCDKLRDLAAAAPERRTLIHGDLRWGNCLRVARDGSGRRSGVMLVDWELAGPGDPAFDVGTVIAEYTANWITSIPVLDPRDIGRLLHEAARPLARDVIGAFWTAYRRASARPPSPRRVTELTGVRLLQSAVELTQDTSEIRTAAKLMANMGANLLLSPRLGAVEILGLEA